jgi:peptidoglycan/LPS O-acetylase OafA/YrhL
MLGDISMSSERANEIDLLRFFSAISVVFFHYAFRGYAADELSIMPYPLAPYAQYGYFGVYLFFMISGFVILMTASNGSLKQFIVSRVVRLYPAFWLCCTLTFIAIVLIGQPKYSATLTQFLINMTMLSGFFYIPPIDGVYWSLFVEIQFYALVSLVLLAGRMNLAERLLMGWLIASIALEIHRVEVLRRLLIVDYSAYFIAGAIFFMIRSEGLSVLRGCAVLGAWSLSLVQVRKFLPGFDEYYRTEMHTSVVAVMITSFFLIMLLVSLRMTGVIGRTSWIMLGALTYPLYLLHQKIGYMIFNIAYPTINPHVLLWGAFMTMMAAAYGITRLEKRFSPALKDGITLFIDHCFTVTHAFVLQVRREGVPESVILQIKEFPKADSGLQVISTPTMPASHGSVSPIPVVSMKRTTTKGGSRFGEL